MNHTPEDENVSGADSGLDAQLDREIREALGGKSLDELLDAEEAPEASPPGPDEMRRGKVIAITGADIFIDLGGRSQGVITADQFPPDGRPGVGDTVEVMIDHYDESEGLVILTRKGAAQKAAWATLSKGDVVEARVTGVNKGGLECDLSGIRAFMPASQIDVVHVPDIATFLGEKFTCRIIELDRRDKNIVLSRRDLLEAEAREARAKTLAEIAEGQVRPGRVKTVMPYGAFVDVGGIDGLLHVSDMSYGRVADPAEVVKPGQQIEVKVLKIEQGGKRISLGTKQLQANPWVGAAEKYPAGSSLTGRVVSLQKFGAFVEVEPGIEALLPIGEITWKQRINHPSEVLSAGGKVEVSVLEVDEDRQRMSVSLKAFETDPWMGAEARYLVNTVVPGTVTRLADFGAFIEVEPGLDGLAHISELSDKPIQRPSDAVRPGQQVQARVLSVSESDRRISLSLKSTGEPHGDEAAEPGEAAPTKRKPSQPLKGGLE